MKIIVSDKLAEEGVQILRDAGHEVTVAWDEPKENLPNLMADKDAIVIRSATKCTAALIDAVTRNSMTPVSTWRETARGPNRLRIGIRKTPKAKGCGL